MDRASNIDRFELVETAGPRKNDEQEAQIDQTAQRLAELENWYCNCLEDANYEDVTLHDEILDNDEIDMEILALVPGIERELVAGYCSTCRKFPDVWSRLLEQNADRGRDHGRDSTEPIFHAYLPRIKYLVAGNKAGCRLCRLFCQGIDLHYCFKIEKRLQLLGKPTTLFLYNTYAFTLIAELTYWPIEGTTSLQKAIPCVFPINKSADSFSPLFKMCDQPSVDCIDRAKLWLTACVQGHPLCKADSRKMPTRLVFLGSQPASGIETDGHQSQNVRLVESASLDGHVLYATLSHCWGGLDFLKLTTGEIDSFKESIPLTRLTKTFQVCFYRSIPPLSAFHDLYSLQKRTFDSRITPDVSERNSKSDWKKEAGLMASVYGGSYINIAASAAEDGSKGLFLRAQDYVQGVCISSTSSSADTPTYAVAPSTLYSDGITSTALASRAWTLQERLLAPRTLHFGFGDLFWECSTKDACESFPDQIPVNGNWTSTLYLRPRQLFREKWQTIIQLYSKAKLTYKTDKLVALAGIAREAQKVSGDEYVAGLWRTGIEELMCWTINTGCRLKDALCRPPSWSWASVDGEVWWIRIDKTSHRFELHSTVLDVTISPSGPDLFGQLNGGILTLGCSAMISAKTIDGNFRNIIISAKDDDIAISGWADIEDFADTDVKLVPLGTRFNLVLRGGLIALLIGLILRSTGGKKGEFERIGMFKLVVDNMDPIWLEFNAALEGFGPSTAREHCAETRIHPETGKEQFVITII
ncbi:uncharacterized protein PAC_10586 [Phialocephala subalpina]|uniref:Heterokaryon incompatibility domain-containing protein n=1 Tax=Phialocephala subalpina TaxID=576137 RepID=A0A1L7X6P3_9HELO|nr:uncharacterized protein PAC_10586 [Phialocephala subalpina]